MCLCVHVLTRTSCTHMFSPCKPRRLGTLDLQQPIYTTTFVSTRPYREGTQSGARSGPMSVACQELSRAKIRPEFICEDPRAAKTRCSDENTAISMYSKSSNTKALISWRLTLSSEAGPEFGTNGVGHIGRIALHRGRY